MKRFCFSDLHSRHNDPEWLAEEHQMEPQVTELEGNKKTGHNKNLSIYREEEHLFDWNFESETEYSDENKRKIIA